MPLRNIAGRIGVLDTRTARPPPKRADADLLTPEHRAWAYAVKDRAGWRCQHPGCDRHGGKGGVRLFAHHVEARRDGGARYDLANGIALCGQHHSLIEAQERGRRLAAPADPGAGQKSGE